MRLRSQQRQQVSTNFKVSSLPENKYSSYAQGLLHESSFEFEVKAEPVVQEAVYRYPR
jgi:hypothetical protein